MLKEFRTQRIIWDTANSRLFDPIQTSGGDQNGRRLEVQILNNGEVEDLTGTDLYLAWQTRNKSHSGLEPFDALDASKGIFELYYPTGMLVNEGALRGGLVLIDSDGRLVSREFTIQVDRNIVDDEAAESSNEFTALTEALVKINDLEENYAPRLNEVTRQLAQKVDQVVFDPTEFKMSFYSFNEKLFEIDITEAGNAGAVQDYIDSLVSDGLIEGVTIADGSITTAKFHPDIKSNMEALLAAMKTEGQPWEGN